MKPSISELAKLIRYYILTSTTAAGSGHPTSSLSAADLMTTLMFGGFFKADVHNPANPNNDRLIFSKGHAAPLLYSLYAAAGAIAEDELLTLRKFGSRLEGHPTMLFPYTEAATGSLGQGLSIGVGMALNARIDKLTYTTYVLLGDSEMAEGSNWEAIQLAAHYKLSNLVAIIDVNRLGQRGETMYGHNVASYEKKLKAFGWDTIAVDGHNVARIEKAFRKVTAKKTKPIAIIAKTLKGKGVKFLENKEGWHGKALGTEECVRAIKNLGKVPTELKGIIAKPKNVEPKILKSGLQMDTQFQIEYAIADKVATRKAYGNAVARLVDANPNVVVLDAETSNSTYAEFVKKKHPEKFFEMFIAEQNMVGAALGLSRRGKIPFVSTFAAFLSRAFDQVRMSQYSHPNIKFIGSHAGVSIGEDGASQMALEDIAMFRTVLSATVLYPSDAVSAEKLVFEAARHIGNVYMRTTRMETPVLYSSEEQFVIGGSKVLRQSDSDAVTIVAAGVTLHEALTAYETLKKEGIFTRVIDLYSVKPIDADTLKKAALETKRFLTVEDHYAEGGIGEAVASALEGFRIQDSGLREVILERLAVRKMPQSGKPNELLQYEEINATAIVAAVKKFVNL